MERHRAGVWLILVVGTLVVGWSLLAADVPISWREIAPLPLPRHSGAVVEVDGLIYVIAGIEYGNQMTMVGQTYDVTTGTLMEAYDPATDSWTRLADLPYPINMMERRAEGRQWPATAAYDSKIYLFGGANQIDVYAYNPAEDRWFQADVIPARRNMAFTATVARMPNHVLLIGGIDETGNVVEMVYLGESVNQDDG